MGFRCLRILLSSKSSVCSVISMPEQNKGLALPVFFYAVNSYAMNSISSSLLESLHRILGAWR